MTRIVKLFIQDIAQSIKNIESFSKGLTSGKLEQSELKQSAIIRQLEIIGEATKNVPDDFRLKYPKMPWKDIAGFRDILIHSYFGVELDKVWKVIKFDLPILKRQINQILQDIDRLEESQKDL